MSREQIPELPPFEDDRSRQMRDYREAPPADKAKEFQKRIEAQEEKKRQREDAMNREVDPIHEKKDPPPMQMQAPIEAKQPDAILLEQMQKAQENAEQNKSFVSIYEMEEVRCLEIKKEKATSSSLPDSTTSSGFAEIPALLGVPQELLIPLPAANESVPIQSVSPVDAITQVTAVVLRSIETLAVRQSYGTTEIVVKLTEKEIPSQFAGSSLKITQTGNRVEIRFESFSSDTQMGQAKQMIERELNRLLATLSTRNMAVDNIYIGNQQIKLPEQYIAHIASLQTSIPLEELIFGKKTMRDAHDAIESLRRTSKKGVTHLFSPPVDGKNDSDLK